MLNELRTKDIKLLYMRRHIISCEIKYLTALKLLLNDKIDLLSAELKEEMEDENEFNKFIHTA